MIQKHLTRFTTEVTKTIKNPLRVKNLLDRKQRLSWFWSYRPEDRTNWEESTDAKFQARNYGDYSEYIRHQGSKLERILLNWDTSWLKKYDASYRNSLREILKPHIQGSGTSVLCLAARIGTEVKSFLDLGCFAVGIDLNPGKDNKYVVFGDFHDLQYADESVDIVFTNSFDHVLYPDKILSEVRRVLKPNGKFFAELAFGTEEGINPGDYESFFWSKLDDLVKIIENHSFEAIHRESISKSREFFIFNKSEVIKD